MAKAKLQQLAGKAVPGMDKYPTLHHIDFDHDEFETFLADPVGVGQKLGLDMSKTTINLEHWDEEWDSHKQAWGKREKGDGKRGDMKPMMNRVICINTGKAVYCWQFKL